MQKKARHNHLITSLENVLKQARQRPLTIEFLLHHLAGRGYAILLILFSLPFCQPLQIPGLSTPFGLLLAFIGLRIAFGHRAWLPRFLLNKTIPYQALDSIIKLVIWLLNKLQFMIRTRLSYLIQMPSLHFAHGLTIFLLGLILALPLPIPLTNLLAALPLLAFGLALLEDDGIFILIAYLLACICFIALILIIWLGKEGFIYLLNKL